MCRPRPAVELCAIFPESCDGVSSGEGESDYESFAFIAAALPSDCLRCFRLVFFVATGSFYMGPFLLGNASERWS